MRAWFTVRNVVLTVFGVLFLMMYIQVQSIFGTFSFLQGRDSSLITEIGELRDSYVTMGSDMNEVREFLRMPEKNYANLQEMSSTDTEGKNDNDVQLALFKYVDFLTSDHVLSGKVAQGKSLLTGLTESTNFADYLNGESLKLSALAENEDGISVRIESEGGFVLATYHLDKVTGKLSLKTMTEEQKVEENKAQDFEAAAIKFLNENKDGLMKTAENIAAKQGAIAKAINLGTTRKVLAESGLELKADAKAGNLEIVYPILNKTGEIVAEISLHTDEGEIWLVDKNDSSMSVRVTDIATGLAPFLQKLDGRTFIEKKAAQALKDLRDTINDKGFRLLLSESGFSIADASREDEDRIYYDIFDPKGAHVSSLVVEKSTGVINIVKPDGTNAENILFFDPEFKKKTLEIPDVVPEYGDDISSKENAFNILIAGKNGGLVDTMIFAHINEDKRTIRMISIPRDLFYNGRKINALAHSYGMPELKKVISKITGYELDKYIVVDMYAFIDVVDLIGGVDITLDSPLIDPSYRVVNNGVASTLHYEPGDYHLGGVEALRLARSRKTSSDFARAERQQAILEAIQDKAQEFGFGDADTIYEIAKSVLSKVETDVTLDEALAYYFRYQSYEIESNDVMTSGNILYVPPYIAAEQCEKLKEEAAAAGQPDPGCDNENQAYTLLPRDNNWNLIKWFFREKFEGV